MNDEESRAIEGADEWDFDDAERRPGVKNSRAVVSVAFARGDFEKVAKCAERSNKRTSEFIREAALEKVANYQSQEAVAAFTGSSATLFTHVPLSTTRLSGSGLYIEEPRGAFTT